MTDPSAGSRRKLIGASTFLALGIYLITGIAGFKHFGTSLHQGKVKYDILHGYEALGRTTPMAYSIAQLAFAFVLVCSYPLLCDPARGCFDALVFGPRSTINPDLRHYLETVMFVAVPTFIAITSESAINFLDLFSSLCGSALVFVLPCVFFLRLNKPYKCSASTLETNLCYFTIVFGVFAAITGTIASISSFF